MSILNQKTLNNPINISGIGLHTGRHVNLSIFPSSPNSGITFKRTDVKKIDNIVIPNFQNVSSTSLCTTIENQKGIKVSTIEPVSYTHLTLPTNREV